MAYDVRPKINIYIWGVSFNPDEDGDPNEVARDECMAAFGTDENCLVVDVAGEVLLNTTGKEIGQVWAS